MADPTVSRGNMKILVYEDCGDCITGILETDEV